MSKTLYVWNLPTATTETGLRNLFRRYGQVSSAKIGWTEAPLTEATVVMTDDHAADHVGVGLGVYDRFGPEHFLQPVAELGGQGLVDGGGGGQADVDPAPPLVDYPPGPAVNYPQAIEPAVA